jgi:hypothetical protein
MDAGIKVKPFNYYGDEPGSRWRSIDRKMAALARFLPPRREFSTLMKDGVEPELKP